MGTLCQKRRKGQGQGDQILQPPMKSAWVCGVKTQGELEEGEQGQKHTYVHTPTHTQGDPYSDLQARIEPTQQSLPAHWHEKRDDLFIFLISLEVPGFYGCGKPRQKIEKKRIFLPNNLPSHIYTGVCWETFPTRWSQAEHVSGTEFTWKYLGHPSSLSIKVCFFSAKTPQRDTGAIADAWSQLGKFSLASACLGPMDPKQVAVADTWQIGAEKWGEGRGFSWASKVSDIPHARL